MNEKTMTTKELAEFFGKSPKTIYRASQKAGIEIGQGKNKVFTKKEVESLSKVLYSSVPKIMQNAINEAFGINGTSTNGQSKHRTNDEVSEINKAFKLAIINMSNIAQSLANKTDELDKRISKIETQTEQRKALLPPPQIKPRDHINMIVREYAQKTGRQYSDVWSELYRQFSYRTNTDPRKCARNRNMGILEYIELEGFIETLEAIAIDVFKED